MTAQGRASELWARLPAEGGDTETGRQPVLAERFELVEPIVARAVACAAVGWPRATHHHRLGPSRTTPTPGHHLPANDLAGEEVDGRTRKSAA